MILYYIDGGYGDLCQQQIQDKKAAVYLILLRILSGINVSVPEWIHSEGIILHLSGDISSQDSIFSRNLIVKLSTNRLLRRPLHLQI